MKKNKKVTISILKIKGNGDLIKELEKMKGLIKTSRYVTIRVKKFDLKEKLF